MRSYLYLAPDGYLTLDRLTLDRLTADGGRGADALVVDLDRVAGANAAIRSAARASAAAVLPKLVDAAPVWVRISPGPAGHEDVRALAGRGLTGVCLARTVSITQLDALDTVLSAVEGDLGLPARSIAVAPLLGSAGAILAAPALARAARVVELHLDEHDLRAELGLSRLAGESELLWVRSQVVLASAAAGLAAPVGAPPADPNDLVALRRSTDALRRMGFGGRACTRPEQVCVVNRVYAAR